MSRLYMSLDPVAMQDPRLDMLDKVLYSYITSWEDKRQVCFAKDGFLANLLGVSDAQVTFSLIKMENIGLIAIVRGSGGRVLQSIPKIIEEVQKNEPDIFDGLY